MAPKKKVHKQELRAFVPPFVIDKIDEYIENGKIGSNRSQVACYILSKWAEGS